MSFVTAQTYAAHRSSVSDNSRLSAASGNEVSSGASSRIDADAPNGARGATDTGLKSTAAPGPRLDPATAKDRIDALIADQVDSGELTSDQASTLKSLFAEDGGKSRGEGGAGGPPAGPPPGAAAYAAAGAARTSAANATPSSDDILATFIEQLKAAQPAGTGYAASGAGGTVNPSARLFDFRS